MGEPTNLETLTRFTIRSTWPTWAILVALAVAIGYAILLYRREAAAPRALRVVLASLRAFVLALLVVLLLEPIAATVRRVLVPSNVLVLIDVSESMELRDQRQSDADLLESARALGMIGRATAEAAGGGTAGGEATVLGESLADLSAEAREQASRASRLELAKAILENPAHAVLRRDTDEVRTRYFIFGDRLEELGDAVDVLGPQLASLTATGTVTRLGSALEEVVDHLGGQKIDGVVVLTDGASNDGADVIDAGRTLAAKAIPVFPVGLGIARPDDLRLRAVVVQDAVFTRDRVPVKVDISSGGYAGRTVDLTVLVDGEEVTSKSIVLEDGSQLEALSFVPSGAAGRRELEVRLSGLPGEASVDNNSAKRTLRVIDEKIKVLYVEGRPRWEYRYLRAVLLRDPRLDVRFLLTEGDPELPSVAPGYIGRFPDRAEDMYRYDLVILGDVPARFFSRQQLEWIETLVRESGGSFLLLAGPQAAPGTYRGTPVASVLPVEIGTGGYRPVHAAVYPVVTEAGSASRMALLGTSAKQSETIWQLVRPLYSVPLIEDTKPGAKVLLSLSSRGSRPGGRSGEEYPLVAWHRYGTGKALFVGTDQLWRLRYRRGDSYHAGFWGQAIRFLTLSRLLGENKRVRVETDRQQYRAGEPIEIYVSALTESFDPLTAGSYDVDVSAEHMTDPAKVALAPVPGSPGLFQGTFVPEREGDYRVEVESSDRRDSSPATVSVQRIRREQLDPSMRAERLRELASVTGGELLDVASLASLHERLKPQPRTMAVAQEQSIWDHWIVFVVFLGCVSLEWFLRRRFDLA